MIRYNINALFLVALVTLTCIRTTFFQPQQLPQKTKIDVKARITAFPKLEGSQQVLKVKVISSNQNLNDITIYTNRYPQYFYGDLLQISGTMNAHNILSHARINKIGSEATFLDKTLENIRSKFKDSIQQSIPEPNASLALGMLLGIENDTPKSLQETLNRTGTLHMLVVSGFNITLVSAFILRLAGLIYRRYAIALALLATWLFVLLAGAQPPALRAGLMSSLALVASLLGRPTKSFYLLVLSALILLVISPELLYSLSFQLSCAATVGVILLPSRLEAVFENTSKAIERKVNFSTPPFVKKVGVYLKEEGSVTISAQITVVPLVLNAFGTFSVISPFSNILVSWSIPYIMLATLGVCLADLFSRAIALILSFVLMTFTAYFLQVVTWTGKLPYAFFDGIKISPVLLLGIYLVLVVVLKKILENKKYSE